MHLCLFFLIVRISGFSRISRSGCLFFCLDSRFGGQPFTTLNPQTRPLHPFHPTLQHQPHPTILYSRPHTRPSGGHGWRSTRTDLNHAEDRQEHTRVPWGGEEERPHALECHGEGGETLDFTHTYTSDLPPITTRHYSPPFHPIPTYLLNLAPISRTIHLTITPSI